MTTDEKVKTFHTVYKPTDTGSQQRGSVQHKIKKLN